MGNEETNGDRIGWDGMGFGSFEIQDTGFFSGLGFRVFVVSGILSDFNCHFTFILQWKLELGDI
jgi:hypothetical protein